MRLPDFDDAVDTFIVILVFSIGVVLLCGAIFVAHLTWQALSR